MKYVHNSFPVEAWKINADDNELPAWVKTCFEHGYLEWCPSGDGLYIHSAFWSEGDMVLQTGSGTLFGMMAADFERAYQPYEAHEPPPNDHLTVASIAMAAKVKMLPLMQAIEAAGEGSVTANQKLTMDQTLRAIATLAPKSDDRKALAESVAPDLRGACSIGLTPAQKELQRQQLAVPDDRKALQSVDLIPRTQEAERQWQEGAKKDFQNMWRLGLFTLNDHPEDMRELEQSASPAKNAAGYPTPTRKD